MARGVVKRDYKKTRKRAEMSHGFVEGGVSSS